ncbi:MAG: hypothetical protein NTV02_00490 [Candidatus Zambryskibacteria bacterium]|nr:hypothetical protein [Candidatus Zambryskibacteria bacterium]
MTTNEALWQRAPEALGLARKDARDAHSRGDNIGGHICMLSAYQSVYSNAPVVKKGFYAILALWHALCLSYFGDLNHNQLNILIQFWIRFYKKLPWLFRGSNRKNLVLLVAMEHNKIERSNEEVFPHQQALAFLNSAQVFQLMSKRKEARYYVEQALLLREEVFKEGDYLLGMRQFVRVYRIAAEVMAEYDTETAYNYLLSALMLVMSDEKNSDQERKVRLEFAQLKKRMHL